LTEEYQEYCTSDDDEVGKHYFDMALIKNDNARLPNWATSVHGKTGLKFSNCYTAKNEIGRTNIGTLQ
jgi:hypothetical protein